MTDHTSPFTMRARAIVRQIDRAIDHMESVYAGQAVVDLGTPEQTIEAIVRLGKDLGTAGLLELATMEER